MNLNEQTEMCAMALAHLIYDEINDSVEQKNSDEVAEMFPISIVLSKLEKCEIDVVIPDMIMLVFDICSSGNPGVIQLMIKELLLSIKASYGEIPKGYIVTSKDFIDVHQTFPSLDIPENEEKYRLMWDSQKKERETNFESDNQCDTVEWWREVL